jgi:hypothetical protein
MADSPKILIDLHYLPSVHWFANVLRADEVCIENAERFQKQTYRNRCKINTAGGIIDLAVPVKHSNPVKLITEVEIDNSQLWQRIHWRTIKSAYGNSPYFEYYQPYFEKLYSESEVYLFDWNMKVLTLCLKLLKKPCNIVYSEIYLEEGKTELLDLRSKIHPKKAIQEEFDFLKGIYVQVFGSEFASGLSVIDLLFCEGPYASQWLLQESLQNK